MRDVGIEESIMPKKDTANTVLGMLSAVGAQTRAADPIEPPPSVAAPEPVLPAEPAADGRPSATVRTLPAQAPVKSVADEAPRTLRLRKDTAQQLREAWLEAKRDDVLLTAQDFASNLVDEALSRRRRQRSASSR
jgi:hypothetical protein